MKRRKDDRGPKLHKQERVVPRDDKRLLRDYDDVVAVFPNASFVCTLEEGITAPVLRFRENALTRHLVDAGMVDLNRLAVDYQNGKFSIDDAMEFWQGLGYSLCGFLDIFGDEVQRRFRKLEKKESAS